MTSSGGRRIPVWLWGVAALLVGGIAVLLALKDRRPEVSGAFRFDISKYRQVDQSQVMFSETGKVSVKLVHPMALAVAADGRIYAAGESRVNIFDAAGSESGGFDVPGAPGAMAAAANGDLFLGMGDHIEVWDGTGEQKAAWESLGEKARITSIAVGEEDVYAADAGQRCVVRYDRSGKLQGRIGIKDESRGIKGFIVPSGYFDVAIDGQGALWVVDPGRHGLENYRPNGDLVSAWYRSSMELDGFCGCCNPIHIAFWGDGGVITAEKGISRVKLYAPDQKLAGLVAGPDVFGERPDTDMSMDMEPPIKDLAVDGKGRVLVLDGKAGVIRIFEEKKISP